MNQRDYRCLIPTRDIVGKPWFPIEDKCICNADLSNPTGRGYTNCPYGVVLDQQKPELIMVRDFRNEPLKKLPDYSLFPIQSYLPPKFQPRALMRIGYEWRN